MGISKGLGPLSMYLDREEGVSFKTDNEMFWCSHCNGQKYSIQVREMKGLNSKFQVSLLQNGKIVLKDFQDMYVSWLNCDGITSLETEKDSPDALCEFEVFNNGERVILKASNGFFVGRSYKHHRDIIEASKATIQYCCLLHTGMGDLHPPCFDISDVELKDVSKLSCRQCVLKKEIFVNKTDLDESHEVTLTWDTRTLDTTQWATTWGMNSTNSTPISIMDSEATITYNGTHQKTASIYRTIAEKRSLTVDVPKQSKITVQLVVSKMDNASIPFTAFIRKTLVNGDVMDLEEKGVWKGLVYHTVTLETKQEPISNWPYPCRVL